MSILGAVPLAVTRYAAGSHGEDGFAPGASSSINIEGSIQPLNSRDRMTLPEGQRRHGLYKLYTTADLQTAQADGVQSPDELVWEGRTFIVIDKLENNHHAGFGLSHFKYFLQEKEVSP